MMEYQCIIRFGKNTLKATFTGGSMNAIGVTPATFTTNNFLIQQAIENSNEFKRGRIRVVSTMDLDEELRIERPAIVKKSPVSAVIPAEAEERESYRGEDSAVVEEVTVDSQPEKQENIVAMTQVEFSCNDDAKDYLEQTFGYIRSKLRNREDIINAGKAHNVEINFI